jgi:hypothetical protein
MSSPWDQIASLARLAPTPHNTQPFRILPRGDDRADLVLLTGRLLPEEDHGNLYVASSFGTFAVALEQAGRHFGVDLEVIPAAELDPQTLPARGPRVLLGEARVRGSSRPSTLRQTASTRRTHRRCRIRAASPRGRSGHR